MTRLGILFLFLAVSLHAHVGSPDVFYDGRVGPYPARVTIRMPNVVPGRAEISARVGTAGPIQVSFLPLYSQTAISNAPPADVGRLVTGETNLYAGELWLMSFGAYSVQIQIDGAQGKASVDIPVTSVALRQLPLPTILKRILVVLGCVLVFLGIAICTAAGRDATLLPGELPSRRNRWMGFFAATAATLIIIAALIGGKAWWRAEERTFQTQLREAPWPDLSTEIRMDGADRILHLVAGSEFFKHNMSSPLIPDHGKLMHLFLIRDDQRNAFAHLHPIRKEGYTFDVVVPPLPEGRYQVFCDLTFEGGVSSTATNSVILPPIQKGNEPSKLARDDDDSWFATTNLAAAPRGGVFHCASGEQVSWTSTKPSRIRQDAELRFSVKDKKGEPIELEPYMGMLSHAAVLREDGSVFSHLHPSGNFSMAAQAYFQKKLAAEIGGLSGADHGMHHGSGVSSVYLPYEFPVPGKYRIFVQFNTGQRIITAIFEDVVGE